MPRKSRKQIDDVLLMALACGASPENAAIKAGLGVLTVAKRIKDQKFARRLQEVKAGMVQRTAAMLTAASTEAVKTLLELQGGASNPSVRLNAARAILELASKMRETAELQERIAAVEHQLQAEHLPFIPHEPNDENAA